MASNKTVLTAAQKAKRSTSFGSELPERPHTLTREVDDLRSDVESAFSRLEAHSSIPVILSGDVQYAAADDSVSANSSLHGVNFLAGQVQASLTLNNLKFTSILPGTAGNSFTVAVVKAANPNDNLAVALNGGAFTITLGVDANGDLDAAKNTNNLIKAAFDTAGANKVVSEVLNAAGGDSDLAVVSASNLAGGTGDGATLHAHALGAVAVSIPIVSFSDTLITVAADTAPVGVVAVKDVVGIVLESNRAKSNPFHAVVI